MLIIVWPDFTSVNFLGHHSIGAFYTFSLFNAFFKDLLFFFWLYCDVIVLLGLYSGTSCLFITTLKLQQKHGLQKRAGPWARVPFQFFEKVVLKRGDFSLCCLSSGWSLVGVTSHQGGLSLGSPLIRVVSHWGLLTSGWSVIGVTSHQGGLSLGSPLIRVVCHWGHLSSGWSVIGVFSHQGGLSLRSSLIRVVCHWGHLSSGWSVIGVISHQGGLSLGSPLIRVVCHWGHLIRVVCHWGHLSSGWSVSGVTSHHGGLSLELPHIRVVFYWGGLSSRVPLNTNM